MRNPYNLRTWRSPMDGFGCLFVPCRAFKQLWYGGNSGGRAAERPATHNMSGAHNLLSSCAIIMFEWNLIGVSFTYFFFFLFWLFFFVEYLFFYWNWNATFWSECLWGDGGKIYANSFCDYVLLQSHNFYLGLLSFFFALYYALGSWRSYLIRWLWYNF